MSGKGSAIRRGGNHAAYAAGWARIFGRKQQRHGKRIAGGRFGAQEPRKGRRGHLGRVRVSDDS